YPGGASQKRNVPIPVFKDDFTYVRGSHNIQLGGTFKPIKDSSTLVNDFNNVSIGLGNPVTSLEASGNAPPDILSPSATADRTWEESYAFGLGRFRAVSRLLNKGPRLAANGQGLGP